MSAAEKYAAAIEAIVAAGGKVTIESVRAQAGGGSARDVSAAIKAWRGEPDESELPSVSLTEQQIAALADAIANRVVEKLAERGAEPEGVTGFLAAAFRPT